MKMTDLFSTTSRVEAPFISVELSGYILGAFSRNIQNTTATSNAMNISYNKLKIDFPNYVKSLNVVKNVNGLINTYTLTLVNAIQPGQDPNFIDKLISKAKKDRRIVFNYGDSALSNHSYKQEEALITKVRLSMQSTELHYTITAVSNTFAQAKTRYTFTSRKNVKPSSVIRELLYSSRYKLTDIFWGLKDRAVLDKFNIIPTDDKPVNLYAKENISPLEYIKYLVNSMQWINDTDKNKTSVYKLAVYDMVNGSIKGPYFKIVRYQSSTENVESDVTDYINIDIGYPEQGNTIAFEVTNDEGYIILYDYNNDVRVGNTVASIDNNGKLVSNQITTILNPRKATVLEEQEKTWWANVTNYPIEAKLTIRGLLRNIELMSKLKIDILFYGQKHHYSGIYMINGVVDSISESGFRTELSLIRVKGVSNEVN